MPSPAKMATLVDISHHQQLPLEELVKLAHPFAKLVNLLDLATVTLLDASKVLFKLLAPAIALNASKAA